MNYVQPATFKDAFEVADNMTPEDIQEWLCISPKDYPEDSLMDAVFSAQVNQERFRCFVLKDAAGKKVLLLGGWDVALGIAWFVTTNEAKKWPVRVFKALLECRDEALKECPYLLNKVMKTSTFHVKLLDRIGAEWVGPITPIGGEPFQTFFITRKEDDNV